MRQQRGIYIVFTTLVIFVFIALVALVVGVGIKSGDRVLLKNNANVVALAAIEGFMNSENSQYEEKVEDGIARAEYILHQNKIKATAQNPVPGVDSGLEISKLEFGNWYESSTPQSSGCTKYPCFKKNVLTANATANAVHVEIGNKPLFHIKLPLTGSLGQIKEDSYAIMVPRCVANLIDTSYSTVTESHPAKPSSYLSTTSPESLVTPYKLKMPPVPVNAGIFAFDENYIHNNPLPFNCRNSALWDTSTTPLSDAFRSQLFWCSMGLNGATRGSVTTTQKHFKSDYVLENTKLGEYWIDKYTKAQPFERFLSSMNTALRVIKRNTTLGDRAILLGFNGAIAADVPPAIDTPGGKIYQLSNDLDYLIQITNYLNLGSITTTGSTPAIYPNFLNEGLLPRYAAEGDSASSTNLVQAIYTGAEAIVGVAGVPSSNRCDEIGKKSIIIATDGLGTCKPIITNVAGVLSSGTYYVCDNTLDTYYKQEEALLDQIRTILLDRKIALTVIIDGNGVNPHYLNVENPDVSPENGTKYLTFEEARFLRYGIDADKPFFNSDYTCGTTLTSGEPCTEEKAYKNAGTGGAYFSRPLAALGRLAFESGGLICPLLNQCTGCTCNDPDATGVVGCYKDNPAGGPRILQDCARGANGSFQSCSLYDLNKNQQAALCAANAVSGNPFALRQPDDSV